MVEMNPGLSLSIGIVLLLILTIGFGGYIMTIVLDQSEKNGIDIQNINLTLSNFLENFANETDQQFIDIFQTFLTLDKNIQGNLTDHRRIANITRDQEIDLLKQILNQSR